MCPGTSTLLDRSHSAPWCSRYQYFTSLRLCHGVEGHTLPLDQYFTSIKATCHGVEGLNYRLSIFVATVCSASHQSRPQPSRPPCQVARYPGSPWRPRPRPGPGPRPREQVGEQASRSASVLGPPVPLVSRRRSSRRSSR